MAAEFHPCEYMELFFCCTEREEDAWSFDRNVVFNRYTQVDLFI